MEGTKIVLCRLCLNHIPFEDGEALDSVERNILQALIPELDLDITYDPKTCQPCNKTMLAAHKFKNACNERLLNNGVIIEEKSELGIVKVEEIKERCVFCMSIINNAVITHFGQDKGYFTAILKKCLPEWRLVKEKKLIPCKNCLEALKNHSAFITTCLDVEGKIREYCAIQGTNSKGKVNLLEVLQFTSGSEFKPSVAYLTSPSKKMDENEDCKFILKTEDVDIKSEDCEEELPEKTCSRKLLSLLSTPAVASTEITVPSKSSEEPTVQAPQNTVQYIIVDANILFKPTTAIEEIIQIPGQRKRPSAIQEEEMASKQQKLQARQDLSTGDDIPGKRSIGIQVNVEDLVKKCNVSIQVDPLDVNTRSIGINAKPDTSNKQVSCRPKMLNVTTTTRGVLTKEKRNLRRKKIQKSRKQV